MKARDWLSLCAVCLAALLVGCAVLSAGCSPAAPSAAVVGGEPGNDYPACAKDPNHPITVIQHTSAAGVSFSIEYRDLCGMPGDHLALVHASGAPILIEHWNRNRTLSRRETFGPYALSGAWELALYQKGDDGRPRYEWRRAIQ